MNQTLKIMNQFNFNIYILICIGLNINWKVLTMELKFSWISIFYYTSASANQYNIYLQLQNIDISNTYELLDKGYGCSVKFIEEAPFRFKQLYSQWWC